MTNINEYLDNRELAILVWLAVFFIWALLKKSIRETFFRVIKSLFQKVIFISICLMLSYIGLMVYFFYHIGLWDATLLSDTVIWIVGIAFVMCINANRVKNDDYFKKAILDNLKLVVVIEFITNLYVFDFWVELILIPILAILGGVMGVSSSNPKYKQVESCLNKIFIVVGLGFLSFAIYSIILDFKGFTTIANLKEFLLPVVFTILLLPFIYIMALYVTYDLIFTRIRYSIRDKSVARYTRWKTIFSFRLNLKSLNMWHDKIIREKPNSRDDVKREILEVKTSAT